MTYVRQHQQHFQIIKSKNKIKLYVTTKTIKYPNGFKRQLTSRFFYLPPLVPNQNLAPQNPTQFNKVFEVIKEKTVFSLSL